MDRIGFVFAYWLFTFLLFFPVVIICWFYFSPLRIVVDCASTVYRVLLFFFSGGKSTFKKHSWLTFLKANLSLLLSRVIGSHFKEALNVPEKCFG